MDIQSLAVYRTSSDSANDMQLCLLTSADRDLHVHVRTSQHAMPYCTNTLMVTSHAKQNTTQDKLKLALNNVH